jgi:hypothetical protein
MQLVRILPHHGVVPELPTFGCRWCGDVDTEALVSPERALALQ